MFRAAWLLLTVSSIACRSTPPSSIDGAVDASGDAAIDDAAIDDAPTDSDAAACGSQSSCAIGYPEPNVIDNSNVAPLKAIAFRDFDGDGMQDVLLAGTSYFVTRRGSGNGQFGPVTTYPGVGTATVVADFDNDGLEDVVSFTMAHGLARRGVTGGMFAASTTFETDGLYTEGLRVANLNGDGLLDLIGWGRIDGLDGVYALFNTGALGFGLPTFLGNFELLGVVDVRGDPTDDLIIRRWDGLQLATNSGTGEFALDLTAAAEIPLADPRVARGVDIDLDSDLDLVIGGATLAIIRNVGGSFLEPERYGTLGPVSSIDTSDLDGNNMIDIVTVSDVNGSNVASVYLTTPTTLLHAGSHPLSSSSTRIVQSVDVTGDGLRDLVFANENAISFLPNRGSGQFRSYVAYPGASTARSSLVDIDGDHDLDVASATEMGVRVSTNQGGLLQPPNFYGTDSLADLVTGDVSGDGRPDVVAVGSSEAYAGVWRGEPGGLVSSGRIELPDRVNDLALVHLDGDAFLDLVFGFSRGSSGLGIARGGPSGFAPLEVYPVPGIRSIATGDIDGDQDIDLVVSAPDGQPDNVGILRNAGNGTFGILESLQMEAYSLTLADIDCDSRLDIVGLRSGAVSIARGTPTGFTSVAGFFVDADRALRVGDLDLDGDLDLVAGADHSIVVLENDGNANFTERLFATRPVSDLALGDLSGDGALEIVLSHASPSSLSVLPATCQ